MIPKIVHYCWFGGKEKPEKVKKCIESWKNILKDYQIIEWNEDNFDVMEMQYTKEAYEAKKYAFVSDVARLKALYKVGGIYLDTDVEVLKTFDEILGNKCIFGMEERNYVATSFMACEQGFPLVREFYNEYRKRSFTENLQNGNLTTNVQRLTEILVKKGFIKTNMLQKIGDIVVYPREYFSPYDYINCIDLRNEDSICIHYFYVTWQSKSVRFKKMCKRILGKVFGKERMDRLRGYHE